MSGTVLVLDVGSSALKAVLFSPDGRVLAEARQDYPTQTPGPGRQEQDPRAWWDALRHAAAALAGQAGPLRPDAVALVGTMENLILVDGAGEPVGPALLYSDGRAQERFATLRPDFDARDAGRRTGNAPDPFMTAFKLAWLRDNEPDRLDRAACVLPGSKDYVGLRLTGVAATDPTNATTTGLMDLATRGWAADLVEMAGVPPRLLPAIRPAASVLGRVTADAAAQTGIPAGTPVVTGCGDAGASTLGAGAGQPGRAYVYLGTTGWIARSTPLDAAVLPRPFFTLAHPEDGLVIEVAPILSAGDCAAWLGRIAGAEVADLDREAEAVDAAPPDILFLPYLRGERSPFVDPNVRGAFVGLDAAHGRAELFHAVLDGVALAIRANLDALGGRPPVLGLLGGGGGGRLWPQLIADATGAEVEVAHMPTTATAAGGLLVARRALGLDGTIDGRGPVLRVSPRPDRLARAETRLARFRSLTETLRALPS